MKLVLAIVHYDDAEQLVDRLMEKDYRATRIDTAGGFLRERNATILLGVSDDKVDEVVELIYESCKTRTRYINPIPPPDSVNISLPYPVQVQVGGANIFVLNVEHFERR